MLPLHLLSRDCKSMNNRIRHSGVIENIQGNSIQVRIVQTSACAACKVAGYCNAAESKEKLVDVFCNHAASFQTGQLVVVSTSGKVASQALLWGFGMPFVILVAVLLIVLLSTGNEGMAALSGIGALVPYYIMLWYLKDWMRKQLTFQIE